MMHEIPGSSFRPCTTTASRRRANSAVIASTSSRGPGQRLDAGQLDGRRRAGGELIRNRVSGSTSISGTAA